MSQAQREWFDVDYYADLGVSKDADQKEITRAYRRLAREHHPDQNPGNADAEERFKRVSAAYDVLGDQAKRREYDEVRRLAASGFGPGGGAGPYATGSPFGPGGGDGGLGDLLGNLFTGRGRGRGAGGPRRGPDLETRLHLDFVDAVRGVTTAVSLTGEGQCRTCHGSGAAAGSKPRLCTTCAGRGEVSDNQGPFSFSQLCAVCNGRGTLVDEPCPSCGGSGSENRRREVKVRLPAGVTDGQRVRLKGRGAPGSAGGPAGDLFVVVSVAPHARFGRRGRDLTVTVPVTFPEAALGADVEVPTLDGAPVTIRVPAGTPSGKVLRVKGRGVPADGGQPVGDLRVAIEVAVPTNLTPAQSEATEALAEVLGENPRDRLGDSV